MNLSLECGECTTSVGSSTRITAYLQDVNISTLKRSIDLDFIISNYEPSEILEKMDIGFIQYWLESKKNQMKHIKTTKGTFLFVEVVEGADYSSVEGKVDSTGTYTLLCTNNTITEDIAENIIGNLYNYFDTVLESFYAFLLYNNLDTNKNYAICKKK